MSSLTEYVAIQQGAWTTKTWVQGFAWLVDDASDDDQLTRPKPRRTRSENMSDRRFLSWTIPCPLWNNNLEFFSFCHYYSCERLWWSDGFVQTRMANSGKWTRERGIAMSAWYGFCREHRVLCGYIPNSTSDFHEIIRCRMIVVGRMLIAC